MGRLKVGLLGKGGLVGQMYQQRLKDHPLFQLTFAPTKKEIDQLERAKECALIFSALPNQVAAIYEPLYAKNGGIVFSSASCHRLQKEVPLIIPEINGKLLKGWKGRLIAKPNCTLQSFLLPLYPLHQRFGLKKASVTHLQSVSGAGKGFALKENVIPYIEGEEEKTEQETLKILGGISIPISVHCTRVPVLEGHLSCVSASFEKTPTLAEVLHCWKTFKGVDLPSAPENVLIYFNQNDRPQPQLDCHLGGGMSVSIGRLRRCPLFDIRFVALSHNLVRGAAGGGLLTAELYVRENQI